ncbi:MAG TPA: acyltransferase [Bacteroidia bacterium]|jgi:peptidoglycan/LPS O-acetylase OafA/YrhL|nr:acyltransferase [Bacteroidia bacterium]
MPEASKPNLYFPGLNGIRFVAAALVIISHIERFKKEEHLANLDDNTLFGTAGEYGVGLFFVLSGFLITYLLLQEDKTTGSIHIRQFYIRRILRIWPLYYFIVFLSFFILPWCMEIGGAENVLKHGYWPKFGLFLFFLPNLSLKVLPPVPFLSQAWSVGTEEQFYLVWPWLLKRFKKMLPALLGSIAIGIILFRKLLVVICAHLGAGTLNHVLSVLGDFLDTFNIECMAIGGLGAWILFTRKDKVLNLIFHPLIQVLILAGLAISLPTGCFGHVKSRYIVNSLLFAGLILNLSSNPRSILKLENSFCRFMGRISYGLYMYHAICFYLVYYLFHQQMGSDLSANLILYTGTFLLTTFLAWISYEGLEKRFLKKKRTYSLIMSGEKKEDRS